MHWLSFLIIAYLCTVIQSTLLYKLELFNVHARPDLLLLAALFFILWWNRGEALIAAWILGFCRDLISAVPLGVSALAFALVAMAVMAARRVIFRDNPLVQVALAFFFAFLVEWLVVQHGNHSGWLGGKDFPQQTRLVFYDAVYSALLAPYLLWLLLRVTWLHKSHPMRAR